MKSVEFRGKRKDNDEWIKGDLLQGNYICDITEISDNESVDGSRYEVIESTIGQYTGIEDKNGIKIFEEDIVSIDNGRIVGEVVFDEDYLAYYIYIREQYLIDEFENGPQPLYEYKENLQVIGNIHDNLDLLN